jgi:hypothetical protein
VRRGNQAVKQPGFGQKKVASAIGSDQGPLLVLAPNCRLQLANCVHPVEKFRDVGYERRSYDHGIGMGSGLDRAIDRKNLA